MHFYPVRSYLCHGFYRRMLPRQVPNSPDTYSDAVMVLKVHRVILAAGSDYLDKRLCTPSSAEGLQYTDGDRVLVERIPAGDERAMEAYL
jgi:hypothetical protein